MLLNLCYTNIKNLFESTKIIKQSPYKISPADTGQGEDRCYDNILIESDRNSHRGV